MISVELARALSSVGSKLPSHIGLVIVLDLKQAKVMDIQRTLSDFTIVDDSSDSSVSQPSLVHMKQVAPQTSQDVYDVLISYVPGEGDDAARSMAQSFKSLKVWFDPKRVLLDDDGDPNGSCIMQNGASVGDQVLGKRLRYRDRAEHCQSSE